MSKVGKNPITLPAGVKVALDKGRISIQGPKGSLTREIPSDIQIKVADGKIEVTRGNDSNYVRALHGTTRSLLANMVQGVTQGYNKEMSLVGVGYRAELLGERLNLQLGYSHPIVFLPPPGIKLEAPGGVKILVSGSDKELVGLVAAKIRSFRPPEPYKGKGIRYTDEHVRKKAGKTAA
jgi:large subunit ribosomal protein L6